MGDLEGVTVQGGKTPKLLFIGGIRPEALQKHALPPETIRDRGTPEKKAHPVLMELKTLAGDLKNAKLSRAPGVDVVAQIETKIGNLRTQIADLGEGGDAAKKAHYVNLTAKDILTDLERIAQFEQMPRYGDKERRDLKMIIRLTSNGHFGGL